MLPGRHLFTEERSSIRWTTEPSGNMLARKLTGERLLGGRPIEEMLVGKKSESGIFTLGSESKLGRGKTRNGGQAVQLIGPSLKRCKN
ncbi:hypothetical protein ACS0TY_033117 [Phlomoides rotata]